MSEPIIRFQDALTGAIKVVREHFAEDMPEHVLVRDLYGRISLILDRLVQSEEPLRVDLHKSLGAFSPGIDRVVLGRGDFFAVEKLTGDPDAVPVDDEKPVVRLLDRRLTGQDWLRGPDEESWADPPRLVFYGIKGGVGRSTALALAAWHLGRLGKRVLVVDLDLESPGISQMLLPADKCPQFGVVDYLVESAVGQANDALVRELYAASPLAGIESEIYVTPCGGQDLQSYTSKLARAYLSIKGPDGREQSFAERLDAMLKALTAEIRPDIVLLDSRAGIHDVAATAITHLGAQTLFFSVNSTQTFTAYDALFYDMRHRLARWRWLRQGFKMVAALVPDQNRPSYMDNFIDRSYSIFLKHIYDYVPGSSKLVNGFHSSELNSPAEASLDPFSFDRRDEEAPHYPLRAFYSREFFGDFSPLDIPKIVTPEQVMANYGDLFRFLEDLMSASPASADSSTIGEG